MHRLHSRKLWVALITALSLVLADGLGLTLEAETIGGVAAIVLAYLGSQGWVDGRKP